MLLGRLADMTQLEAATLRAAVLDTPPLPVTRNEPTMPESEPWPGATEPPSSWHPANERHPLPRRERPTVRAHTVSLSDRAVRLLLQDPSLARQTSPEELDELGLPPDTLLVDLVRLMHAHPGIGTPTLMMHWYGTDKQAELAGLAASEFLTPHEGITQEFQDVLRRLRLTVMESELKAATELDVITRLKRKIENLKRGG
jgi:hypothetical protein